MSSSERANQLNQVYLAQIARVPLLSPEKQEELLLRFWETGSLSLRNKIVEHNLRLVIPVAKKYRVRHGNLWDLVQQGNLGLIRAVECYQPDRGVKFSTYATYWIKAQILKYVNNNAHLLRISTTQDQRKIFFGLNKARIKLQARGVEPTPEALAQELNVKVREVETMIPRLDEQAESLDPSVQGEKMIQDIMPPEMLVNIGQLVEDKLTYQKIAMALSSFMENLGNTERATVLGRLVGEKKTCQEIADSIGVSKQRVSQVEQKIKPRMIEYLRKHV